MIICPNCRAKLGDGSSTCVVCGTSLSGGSTTPKAPEPAQAAAPAVAASAPATAADTALPKVELAEKPLPRDELLEEAKPAQPAVAPQKPAQAQVPQKPAQALPPQAPPPPDHPIYQQQQYQQQYPAGYYPVQATTNWETHPYTPGQPNQCPRCHNMNVVTFYDNGTAVCGACYYKYYWRAAGDPFSSVGREINKLWG